MSELATVILAAGLGKRMRSDRAKVLHELAGRPLVCHVLDLARRLGSARTVLVLGHQAGEVTGALGDFDFETAIQAEQLGTGHAVTQAMPKLEGFGGRVLVLYGDVPLLSRKTAEGLLSLLGEKNSPLAFITAEFDDPSGYGRVVRRGGPDGPVVKVVEDKDADDEIRKVREINSGIIAFDADFLRENLPRLKNDNAQGEYYLTDLVALVASRGEEVPAFKVSDPAEVAGINSRAHLAEAEAILGRRTNEKLMSEGVSFIDPERAYVEPTVEIGRDTVIHPGAALRGKTRIGRGCLIETGAVIADSVLGNGVIIKPYCVIAGSEVGDAAAVGPMAHLRPGSRLAAEVKVGNFVETKKAAFGKGAKASHLAYLGDAEIGPGVNVGCGTITCNYDGEKKHLTVIEEGAFIGSDTQLVAPVTVGKGAYVASGATVTEDVPPGALAISRVRQRNIEGWVEKKKGKKAVE